MLKELPTEKRNPQRGSALVLAVFVLVIVSLMGLGLLFLAQAEMGMSQASLRHKEAFFLAEAGLEDARTTLFQANGEGPFADDLIQASGVNGVIDFDPSALRVVYDSDGNFVRFTGYGDDVPLRVTTPMGNGSYIAFLTNDAIDVQTLGPVAASALDTNDRVVLTGAGIARDRSFEIVQAIIEPFDPMLPMPPAAITLLGPTPSFAGGTSEVSEYSGDDCLGNGDPTLHVATVGAVGADAELSVERGVYENPSSRKDTGPDYTSGSNTGKDTVVDLNDTSEDLVSQPIDSSWTECAKVKDMVESLRKTATFLCTGDSCSLPSGTTTSDVTFIDNGGNPNFEFALGPGDPDGEGVLVVTGKLVLHGAREWSGIILAIGRGEVVRYGAGGGLVSGGIVVGDIAGADDMYGTDDDCKGDPNNGGFDIADYSVAGGGVGDTSYCSIAIDEAEEIDSYSITHFQQR